MIRTWLTDAEVRAARQLDERQDIGEHSVVQGCETRWFGRLLERVLAEEFERRGIRHEHHGTEAVADFEVGDSRIEVKSVRTTAHPTELFVCSVPAAKRAQVEWHADELVFGFVQDRQYPGGELRAHLACTMSVPAFFHRATLIEAGAPREWGSGRSLRFDAYELQVKDCTPIEEWLEALTLSFGKPSN